MNEFIFILFMLYLWIAIAHLLYIFYDLATKEKNLARLACIFDNPWPINLISIVLLTIGFFVISFGWPLFAAASLTRRD